MMDNIDRQCEVCGNVILTRNRKYCSRACCLKSRNLQGVCVVCGKVFKFRKYRINRGNVKYCSVECRDVGNRKREFVEHGGVNYYLESNGYFSSWRGVKLHRVIWENCHGEIPPNHIVHHIDKNKTNNDIKNLKLFEWGQHTKHHHERGCYG